MLKKLIIGTLAALMLLLTVISAVKAAPFYPALYPDLHPVNPSYFQYDQYQDIPNMYGPFPRYYTGFNNYRSIQSGFMHDDFNHFDEYIGYRDLDVFYPDRGYVDVLRNPSASLDDLLDPRDRVYDSDPDGYNVYGVIPGGGVYMKHYYHDHPWDAFSEWGGYAYDYFEPLVAYRNKPVFTNPCSRTSACQYTHCCA